MTLRCHLRLLQEYMQYPRIRELLTSPKQATHPLRSEPRKQMPQNPSNHRHCQPGSQTCLVSSTTIQPMVFILRNFPCG
ncbi:hypothetical protein NP493_452g01030 [Ridgeia piscesae]|uniref:Uncharacterized protein n=1 Tax=Ridgeia piscesae TaxID=27915 RepID=A0AAD9L0M6_RIDPI|nr:hypothetical protein NP493_452g01030 [Ridgeia piscesae]